MLGEIKFWNLKSEHIEKKSPKGEKNNNFTFHDYLPQCGS